jgi:hypothetical protein
MQWRQWLTQYWLPHRWFTQLSDWQGWIRVLILVYCLLAGYAYYFADRQIFLPQYARHVPLPRSPIAISTADNERLTAIYLRHPKATYTLLYSHGNAETLGDIYPQMLQLQSFGFNVLAYDYRGYGLSSGQPSEQNAYADIVTIYRYATETLKIAPDRIIVFGRSVGGGPSTYLASQQPIAGLILESTFISIFRVVAPFPFLPFDKFPNRDRVRQIQVPLLVIHGDRDAVIPLEHGKALLQAANPPKQLLIVPNAGHSDVSAVGGTIYRQAIQEFATDIAKNR